MAAIYTPDAVFKDIAAVLFDKDGTLAGVAAYLQQLGQLRSRLLEAQVPSVGDAVRQALGLGAQVQPGGLLAAGSRAENVAAAVACLIAAGCDRSVAQRRVTEAFAKADAALTPKAPHTPPLVGATALIKALDWAGVKLGIVSADSQPNVDDFVQTYRLTPYFGLVQGLSPALPVKTEPAFWQQACRTLAVSPAQLLVIGDSATDVKLAADSGAAGFIGVTGGWSEPAAIATTAQFTGQAALISHLGQILIEPSVI
ncbi:MAG: HAD family hydrolase [Leptolyngbya sp. SIO4C1]|nr:HAD family hydrolase [Leptolyngbya sp. SIO4C1]